MFKWAVEYRDNIRNKKEVVSGASRDIPRDSLV